MSPSAGPGSLSAPVRPPPSRRLVRLLPWIALVVVAVIALVIGTERHSHPTVEQRTTSIAGAVRCPVCSGETVAQSETRISVQIRDYIHKEVVAGKTRSEILSSISASYGSSILESPPAKGINVLLWVFPVGAIVVAVAGLGIGFARWRIGRTGPISDGDRLLVSGALHPEAPSGHTT